MKCRWNEMWTMQLILGLSALFLIGGCADATKGWLEVNDGETEGDYASQDVPESIAQELGDEDSDWELQEGNIGSGPSLDCKEIVDCSSDCDTSVSRSPSQCREACYSMGTPDAQLAYRQLLACQSRHCRGPSSRTTRRGSTRPGSCLRKECGRFVRTCRAQ